MMNGSRSLGLLHCHCFLYAYPCLCCSHLHTDMSNFHPHEGVYCMCAYNTLCHKGLKAELPEMSKRALLVLPITHTAVDVERSSSFYKLARSEKQLALTNQHHIGRISFAMNGLVPRVQP